MQQDCGYVGKNVARFPHTVARIEFTEILGSVENYFSAPVGKSGQEMPEQISL